MERSVRKGMWFELENKNGSLYSDNDMTIIFNWCDAYYYVFL